MANRDKALLRTMLENSVKINFKADVHTLSHSQRTALQDMAKSVGYRKSVSSSLSLGAAFFVYLARGTEDNLTTPPSSRAPGRWSNHGIAK